MEQAGEDMIHFSERKESKDRLEEQLQRLKKEYHKPEMSKAQVEKLREKMNEACGEDGRQRRKAVVMKYTAAAAVFLAAFLILPNTSAAAANAMEQIPVLGRLIKAVTFRDYAYESERNMADIKVPELTLEEQAAKEQTKLRQTTEEINEEIRSITNELVEEFKKNLDYEGGYQDVMTDSEVLAQTEDYFTLQLKCYQGAGSGYAWNYYYTIDLHTGERLSLKDIFNEGADYITPISESIKQQMKAQMEADEDVYYWLNDEIEEWNFKSISDDTSFYLNEAGNVVIAFNEGDVAPMYMGALEFEIPANVLETIRK
ncbi:Anti-sigma-V factor RsiV [Eubacterium plexicaudatum ASF492]|uniref:DUF3298 domain-containing protein n=1 Tax=Eubacterium plexicaudatum ASF492 TaxID=1235802 RepID=N2A423_9FIRM|nr:Anti-sigma-V factor RsiV [Eubacterium plexicaudatum ASF492]